MYTHHFQQARRHASNQCVQRNAQRNATEHRVDGFAEFAHAKSVLRSIEERLQIGHLDEMRAKRLRRYAKSRFHIRLAIAPHDVLQQADQRTDLVARKRRHYVRLPHAPVIVRWHAQKTDQCEQRVQRLLDRRSRDGPTMRR